jgi:ATP-binding cassette, subfamily B, multidrug efflux pump
MRNDKMMKKDSLKDKNIKRSLTNISKDLKKYYFVLIVAVLLIALSVILQVVAPQYLKDLTNEISNNAASKTIDLDKVSNIGILLIVLYIITVLSIYFSNFIITTVSQRYSQILRRQISEKINRIPLNYFDTHQFGDLLSRLTNDVDQIGMSLQQSVSMLLQSIMMLVGVLIAMFITSWAMALTALATVPLMAIFLLIIIKFAAPMFMKRSEEIGKVNSIVEENFSGQLIIKVFNAEERVNQEFDNNNNNLRNTMFKAQIYGGMMMPIMSFISYFAYAAIFIVGGLLLNEGNMGVTFGTISAFMTYVNLFQSPLSQIAQAANTLQTAAASSKRVFDFLAEQELDDEDNKEYKLLKDGNKVKGQVIFEHVNFSYNKEREIIHDFSSIIKPGMKVAIVGPTGAGKTTMVNLLERFYEINGGHIYIDGVDTKTMPRSEIRDIFGMVLQDTWIFEGTIRENLIYNTKGITDDQINEVLKEVGLYHYVESLPNKLDFILTDNTSVSNGQKQLITIARAMLKNAPLMILDEATSNVDTRTEEIIQESMDKLTKGRTSFVIAHRLSTIRNSDLILVMKDGNIIEQGTHDQLMEQKGFYCGLYNSQFALD